jgi:prophage tail gpP-like protein
MLHGLGVDDSSAHNSRAIKGSKPLHKDTHNHTNAPVCLWEEVACIHVRHSEQGIDQMWFSVHQMLYWCERTRSQTKPFSCLLHASQEESTHSYQ